MGDVIDLFSGRKLVPMQVAPMDVAGKGEYIGKMPSYAADLIRSTAERIRLNTAQQEKLMTEFATMYDDYVYLMTGALELLGVDLSKVNPQEQDLYVDENGDAWLVTLDPE